MKRPQKPISGWVFVTLFVLCTFTVQKTANGGPAMNQDDKTKIAQIAEQWVPALRSGSVERNMSFFADDIVIAGGGRLEVHVGSMAVKRLLEQLLGDSSAEDCSIEVQGIDIMGEWAELRAKFKAVWQPKKKGVKVERESSHYIWLLKRQADGAWKIARFLFYPRNP